MRVVTDHIHELKSKATLNPKLYFYFSHKISSHFQGSHGISNLMQTYFI